MVLSKLALKLAFVVGATAHTGSGSTSGSGATWDPMGKGSVFLRMFDEREKCESALRVQGANDPTKDVGGQRTAVGAWHGPGDGAACMTNDHDLHAPTAHQLPDEGTHKYRAHVTCASSGNSVFVEIYKDKKEVEMCGKPADGSARKPVHIYFQVVRSGDDKCWHYQKDTTNYWFSLKGCDDYGARNSLLNHILSSWGGGFHHHH